MRNVLAHTERAGTSQAYLGSYEIVGPPGSGKTRVLAEIARSARARGFEVLQASGGAAEQPWGGMATLARALLSRLPADHPLRDERGVRALVGDLPTPAGADGPALADGASSALADLFAAALRGSKAVVLLDDEDALSGHALRVWRSLARHVATASGSSQALSVLLVATSANGAPPELGTPRERAELADLTPRHVAHLVAELLTERGSAAILAAELSALAGGRPGEIVDHLRDMRDRGVLVPVGRRYHVVDAAAAVRAGSSVDRLRRAADAAGRDATALAETIAVCGRLRLPREVLAEIAELSGPRLHAAAESALRAGLLRRDGAAWRARTESVRARLESAMPDDRRRGLHREVLAHLLDAADADWPAIAHHGRAAGDPRAAEWTRRALDVLRAAGRFDEAATHFDDARALLDPGALDVELRLVQVDTLLHAGRLDDATRCADEVSNDALATPLQRGHALLALARLHRYDQAWSRVLAIQLPIDCGDPAVLARIRLLRAIAHVFRGRPDLAEREERLASAEVGGEISAALPHEEAELRVEAAVWDGPNPDATLAIVRRLRLSRRRGDSLQHVLDLVRLANHRRRVGATREARAILRHASAKATRSIPGNALALLWINSTEAYCHLAEHRPQKSIERVQATLCYAHRTGAAALILNKQVELASIEARAGNMSHRSFEVVRALTRQLDDVPADFLSLSAGRLAVCFSYCGLHDSLLRLRARLHATDAPKCVRREVADRVHESAFALDDLGDFAAQPDEPWDVAISRATSALVQSDEGRPAVSEPGINAPVISLLAALVRRRVVLDATWPDTWSPAVLTDLCLDSAACSDSRADLLYSLLLLPFGAIDADLRSRLTRGLEHDHRGRPTTIEWRRTLALARTKWERREIRDALKLVRLSEAQAHLLGRPESGHLATIAVKRALELIAEQRIVIQPQRPRSAMRSVETRRDPSRDAVDAWEEPRMIVRSTQRYILESRYGREMRAFVESAHERVGPPRLELGCGQTSVVAILEVSVTTPESDVRASLVNASRHLSCGGRAVLCVIGSLQAFRDAGPTQRRLVECFDGVVISLPGACATPAGRLQRFQVALDARFGRAVMIDAEAAAMVRQYGWPGGLAELEGVTRELQLSSEGTVDAPGLLRLRAAFSGHAHCADGVHPIADVVLAALDSTRGASSSEVSRKTRRPLRTIVRVLAALCATGHAQCAGRGRATRYWRSAG